ncbi:transketolase [Pandoraea sp. XJJ-1]|uniref:transketolase n=1 Tax=unclassified Pandoraea TaxID=2624094 RepID=UPI00096144F4|nr:MULTISPECIES: transketolase [unclassified Pandoraea]MBN9116936.1 transketolase [Pandoraea sp.]OJY20160.1 MAG: transketolase [Pandoraea sp. 64-18]WAL84308.1 transketolase [Pandoraea sp. XJJ-1]BDD94936.1 transketolase [Pandoraea sp. NE5]
MSTVASPPADTLSTLAQRAHRIRHNAITMAEVQGQGYVAQALGIADVLAVAYLHAMNVRPHDPEWEARDRFLLSVGHYAIAHYAVLAEAGYFPREELVTYGCDDSRLPMSGMMSYTPGAEMSGGSIGLGLPMAVGMGLGLKRKQSTSFVYTLMGDGELAEGPTWEAATSASAFKLDNIIAVVDVNGVQADGPSTVIMPTEPLVQKFEAFGFYTQRVNGNDLAAVLQAFDNARSHDRPVPRIIICDTKMGKGVDFLEAREKNHFIRLDPPEWQRAFSALNAQGSAA